MLGLFKRAQTSALTVQAVSASEVGLVRADNQDHVLVHSSANLYCVADGMGGGAEGARASEIVCRELRMMMNVVEADFDTQVAAAHKALVEANQAIFTYARERGFAQMGTTAAVLVFDPADARRAGIQHVGDSRVYRIRGGLAKALTRDHRFGFTHALTRAIGALPYVVIDYSEIDVRAGDRYLICSDGVHDVISPARLAVFAGAGPLEKARVRLSEEILKAGALDNFSFVLIEVT